MVSAPPSSAATLLILLATVRSGQGIQLSALLLLYTLTSILRRECPDCPRWHHICAAFAAQPWTHVTATGSALGRAYLLGDVKNPCPAALDLPLEERAGRAGLQGALVSLTDTSSTHGGQNYEPEGESPRKGNTGRPISLLIGTRGGEPQMPSTPPSSPCL